MAELNKETAKQGSYTAAYQTVVDKVAYTWFNRLIAVRYMEVNDLLPSRTRVLSSTDGRAEPQIVTSPFDAVLTICRCCWRSPSRIRTAWSAIW